MNDRDEQLRSELMEAMLEYIEGKRTFRSIATIGVTEHAKNKIQSKYLAEVISELNDLAQNATQGKFFSREKIIETFTLMLEKLLKD